MCKVTDMRSHKICEVTNMQSRRCAESQMCKVTVVRLNAEAHAQSQSQPLALESPA